MLEYDTLLLSPEIAEELLIYIEEFIHGAIETERCTAIVKNYGGASFFCIIQFMQCMLLSIHRKQVGIVTIQTMKEKWRVRS